VPKFLRRELIRLELSGGRPEKACRAWGSPWLIATGTPSIDPDGPLKVDPAMRSPDRRLPAQWGVEAALLVELLWRGRLFHPFKLFGIAG